MKFHCNERNTQVFFIMACRRRLGVYGLLDARLLGFCLDFTFEFATLIKGEHLAWRACFSLIVSSKMEMLFGDGLCSRITSLTVIMYVGSSRSKHEWRTSLCPLATSVAELWSLHCRIIPGITFCKSLFLVLGGKSLWRLAKSWSMSLAPLLHAKQFNERKRKNTTIHVMTEMKCYSTLVWILAVWHNANNYLLVSRASKCCVH